MRDGKVAQHPSQGSCVPWAGFPSPGGGEQLALLLWACWCRGWAHGQGQPSGLSPWATRPLGSTAPGTGLARGSSWLEEGTELLGWTWGSAGAPRGAMVTLRSHVGATCTPRGAQRDAVAPGRFCPVLSSHGAGQGQGGTRVSAPQPWPPPILQPCALPWAR